MYQRTYRARERERERDAISMHDSKKVMPGNNFNTQTQHIRGFAMYDCTPVINQMYMRLINISHIRISAAS